MIDTVSRMIGSSALANVAQSTTSSVMIETTLKSIGRPGFILIDKDIDHDTKQYAAAKEFIYQVTCLLVYLALVVPVFKKGSFKVAKNIFKDAPEFNKFESAKDYFRYIKLCDTTKNNRIQTLGKEIKGVTKKNAAGIEEKILVRDEFHADVVRELETKDDPNRFPLIKGAIEVGNIVGSVLGLAVLAPQVSHAFIHPALRFVGLEKDNGEKTAPKLDKQG